MGGGEKLGRRLSSLDSGATEEYTCSGLICNCGSWGLANLDEGRQHVVPISLGRPGK
jgi:hypothetical protein